ncbi:hypothetical protein EHS25_007534 [Saitozyma podzolica]|uniref:Major facilitator superfamily (MFS) profile domain-containing protein n=1 Tax=Saitozyma podzolica TaxID=1890683 RepID=A0A427YQ11_9TREE|nr:hypothetical protein EHS25_007534 [Saitozyma podzolica]
MSVSNNLDPEKYLAPSGHVKSKADEGDTTPPIEEFDAKFEKRLIRKLDLLIMPAACFLYLFSSLDKGNLGNAKTLGMIGASGIGADPTGSRYALLNALYFIGYVNWMIPTTLFAKRTKVNLVIGCSGIWWGIAAASTAAVNSYGTAMAARYFVGFGEAGFGPVIPFYLARWYTERDLALRMSIFLFSGPLAGVINGLVSYGVSFIKGSLAPWRLLFIIEGCPAILAGIFALSILPGDVTTTRWLTDKERACAAMSYQCVMTVGAALGAFLPTLVSDVGYTGAIAQVYTLPPYAAAAVCMLVVCWVSDRYQRRGPGMIAGFAFMTLGFAMLLGLSPSQKAGRYASLVFCEVGQFICIPLNLTWAAENAGNESRKAVSLPLVITLGQALAIASGYLFPAKDSPTYRMGSGVCMGLCIWGMIISVIYTILLRRENARRDMVEGPAAGAVPDTATYADKAVGFRYVW